MADWWWRADYFETCNCEILCPCNTISEPSDGTCKAIIAYKIREGAAGEVKLDGLGVALIASWPNAIHEGNGTAVIYVDERADEAQREALGRIGRGEAGPGGAFEMFAKTYTAKVVVGAMTFERDGKEATVVFGDAARAEWEPIRSKMNNEPADVYLTIPDGFLFRNGEMISTKHCRVEVDGLSFEYENSSAFFDVVEYNV